MIIHISSNLILIIYIKIPKNFNFQVPNNLNPKIYKNPILDNKSQNSNQSIKFITNLKLPSQSSSKPHPKTLNPNKNRLF